MQVNMYVIKVNQNADINKIAKDIIHKLLECNRHVSEFKLRPQKSIMSHPFFK